MPTMKSVVIQISQSRVVCGFSNQDLPQLIVPSQYLVYKSDGSDVKVFGKWEMIEHCDDESAEIYQLYAKNGLPNDWDMMDAQWQYIFERLGIQFDDYPVCVVLPSDLNSARRKRFVEQLLGYGFPMVQLLNEAVCNTLSQGRSSGIVVDIGHSGVKVDVVIDGVLFKQYRKENKIGGAFLNWQICDQYLKQHSGKSTKIWRDATEWLPNFKNSMLQVSPIELDANYDVAPHYQHMVSPMDLTKNFLLDKKTLTFTNKQLYTIGELLFKPVIHVSNNANGDVEMADVNDIEKKPHPEKLIGVIGLIRACIQSLLNGVNAMSTAGSNTTGSSTTTGNASSGNQINNNENTNIPTHSYTSEQLQSLLLTNILVTGSTSNIQGLEQRILNDVSVSLNDLTTVRPKILFKQTKLDRNFQSWQSATTLCRLPLRESLHAWESIE
ncbi:Arp7 [Kluyveromyces lactis]|nr:Arp7 [Kluyveromyces lactis]